MKMNVKNNVKTTRCAMYNYMEVDGVPNKLLDRILMETISRDSLEKLIKDNPNPKMKALKLKYKINPKQRLTEEQIVGILLDYFEMNKSNEVYSVLVQRAEERFEETLEENYDDYEDIDITIDFTQNIEQLIEVQDMPDLITYIRQNCEELHKYVPALIKTWMGSEEFKKYKINDLYGFDYGKTFEEEFDVELDFDCLDKDMITDKSQLECMLEASDDPMCTGINIVVEHLDILKGYIRKNGLEVQDKTKAYEKLLSEKEKELNEFKRKARKLEDRVDSISKEKEELSKSLEMYEKRYEDNKEKLVVKEAKVEELKKEKRTINSQLKAAQNELEGLKAKYDELLKSTEAETVEAKALAQKEEAKRLEIEASLAEIIQERDLLREQNALIKEQVELDNHKIAELENTIKDLKNTLVVESEVSVTSTNVEIGDDLLGDSLGDAFLGALSNEPTF